MSQESIAIIVAAIVTVALAAPVHAQVDCADWNTAAFFEVAGVLDVTRCLQIGADPDARDKDGKSPLHFATDNGSAEAVMALLDASADHDVWDRSGFTPLHRAAAHGNAEAVTALLDAGADPNIRGEAGMTPLHGAGTAGAVAALIEAGADPNAGDELGWTPLHLAARSGTGETVTALVEAGADPNAGGESGVTPLHLAARSGTGETVIALVEAGADPNAGGESGVTLLHLAARFGTGETVTALLEAGADPNARDNDGKLPVDYAADNEQLKDTDGYWKLNDARFQSREIGEGGFRGSSDVPVFRGDGNVTAPILLTQVLPEYSIEARRSEHEGTVILETIIRQDGTVDVVRVVRSLRFGLNEKAIEAVKQWRFRPGTRNGEPVDVALRIEVNFNLR